MNLKGHVLRRRIPKNVDYETELWPKWNRMNPVIIDKMELLGTSPGEDEDTDLYSIKLRLLRLNFKLEKRLNYESIPI